MIGGNELYTSPIDKHDGRLHIKRVKQEDKEDVKELKRLNAIIFPQAYNDLFYRKMLPMAHFYLVYDSNRVAVGTFSFFLKDESSVLDATLRELLFPPVERSCYIMNLGVLSVYRRRGYGTLMWNLIQSYAEEHFGAREFEYTLHVQQRNKSAILFYHNLGFQQVALAKDYYRSLENADALVMARNRHR